MSTYSIYTDGSYADKIGAYAAIISHHGSPVFTTTDVVYGESDNMAMEWMAVVAGLSCPCLPEGSSIRVLTDAGSIVRHMNGRARCHRKYREIEALAQRLTLRFSSVEWIHVRGLNWLGPMWKGWWQKYKRYRVVTPIGAVTAMDVLYMQKVHLLAHDTHRRLLVSRKLKKTA